MFPLARPVNERLGRTLVNVYLVSLIVAGDFTCGLRRALSLAILAGVFQVHPGSDVDGLGHRDRPWREVAAHHSVHEGPVQNGG